jgi:hypothetical protein
MVEISQPRIPDFNGDHSALSEPMGRNSICKNVCVQAADERVKVVPYPFYIVLLKLTSLCLICSQFTWSLFGEEFIKIYYGFVFYWFFLHFL